MWTETCPIVEPIIADDNVPDDTTRRGIGAEDDRPAETNGHGRGGSAIKRPRNVDDDDEGSGNDDEEWNFLHEVLPDGQAYLVDTSGLFSQRGVSFHTNLLNAIHGDRFSSHWEKDSMRIKVSHQENNNGRLSVSAGYFLPIHWGVDDVVVVPNGTTTVRRTKKDEKLNINQFRKKRLDWMDSQYLETNVLSLLADFATAISDAVLGRLDGDQSDRLFAFPMVLKTGEVPHKQELHVDEERKLIEAEKLRRKKTLKSQGYKLGFTGHTPLGKEGMVLRIVVRDDEKKIATVRFYRIPYGYTLLLRSDVIHSGFFGSPGNCRLHTVHIQRGTRWNDDGVLFVHETRGYFEAGNYEYFDLTADVEAKDAFKVATTLLPGSCHPAKRPKLYHVDI